MKNLEIQLLTDGMYPFKGPETKQWDVTFEWGDRVYNWKSPILLATDKIGIAEQIPLLKRQMADKLLELMLPADAFNV